MSDNETLSTVDKVRQWLEDQDNDERTANILSSCLSMIENQTKQSNLLIEMLVLGAQLFDPELTTGKSPIERNQIAKKRKSWLDSVHTIKERKRQYDEK